MLNEEQRRYPIGKFLPQETYTTEELTAFIERIEALPARLEDQVKNFSESLYDKQYREGGWTARQVIHHLADSHMNAYIRIKWALTEASPIIKAYDEKAWAETPEVNLDPVVSITFIKALHVKLAALLRLIPDADRKKAFVHPTTNKSISIERMMALYSWHGEHHLGHLRIISDLS